MSPDAVGFILEPAAAELLTPFGVSYPRHGVARNAEEAVATAEAIGYPAVLKVVSPDVIHKSDVGGVLVGLRDAQAVRSGYERIIASVCAALPEASVEGVLVCEQVLEGIEVIVGVTNDQVFGPTIMFGLGGVFVEVLNDVSFRVVPLKRVDAQEMIRECKGSAVLSGLRGKPRADVDALVDLIVSVSDFVVGHGRVVELDLNPVRVNQRGARALDVRLILGQAGPTQAGL